MSKPSCSRISLPAHENYIKRIVSTWISCREWLCIHTANDPPVPMPSNNDRTRMACFWWVEAEYWRGQYKEFNIIVLLSVHNLSLLMSFKAMKSLDCERWAHLVNLSWFQESIQQLLLPFLLSAYEDIFILRWKTQVAVPWFCLLHSFQFFSPAKQHNASRTKHPNLT